MSCAWKWRAVMVMALVGFVLFILLVYRSRTKTKSKSESFSSGKLITKQNIRKLKYRLDRFVDRLYSLHKHEKAVKRLHSRYRQTQFYESLEKETYTINKGEEMWICMRNYSNGGQPHTDMNLLMFVGLHEFGHIMSVSNHHTPEFWSNFRYLLKRAIELGMYQPVDYAFNPTPYCEMLINENPYFSSPSTQEEVEDMRRILFN